MDNQLSQQHESFKRQSHWDWTFLQKNNDQETTAQDTNRDGSAFREAQLCEPNVAYI